MKTRILLLAISTMLFSGCEGDIPPKKTVGNITFVITEEKKYQEGTPEYIVKMKR